MTMPRFLLLASLSFFLVPAGAQTTVPDSGQSATQESPQQQTPPVQTTVTVSEKLSSETAASLVVLGQQQLVQTPGVNLDDRLRQVPGFSLFRRSSSLVANPTTQGVSLRAIGSTGASRTLVLWNGVPLNDPFGGWIYWTRVDPNTVDRVEILRGANTSVFGYQAMGGAIALFSPQPQHEHVLFSYMGGNNDTHELSGAYSNLWNRFGVSANIRGFTSDGYYIVPSDLRGTADDRANVRFITGGLNLDYLGDNNRLNLHFDTLAEERHNGTVLQNNSTSLGSISGTYTHTWQKDQLSVIAYHTREQYHSTFSSISVDRNTERLTLLQSVPAEDLGGAAYWQHHARQWNVLAGADVDDTHGTSNEFSYTTLALTHAGGTLLQHGVFGQADVKWGPARFYGGIRHHFTGLGGTFVSPNAGATLGWRNFRFRASGYRSQRTPTLNELYRNFRVGNVLTLANAALVPERLVGAETGVDWVAENHRLSVTLFHDDLSQLIANATLSTSPSLILRQRRNLSSGLSRGFETSYRYQWHNWFADANYMYADARLNNGLRLAQVPKQQGTGGVTYARDSTLVSLGIRAFGLQFDDDLNQFKLPGYAALQLAAQQRVYSKLFVQAAVENLLDRTYYVAMTPTPNTGAPRLWRVGLRWSGPIR
jgi:outer membrane cobalamin receptor